MYNNYTYNSNINDFESIFESNSSSIASAGVWALVSIVLAIVGGILVYFLFVKKDAEPKGKFAKWLKDFLSFKIMWIEGLLKVVYYIGTIFFMLVSFAFIAVDFAAFISLLVVAPVVLRICYEAAMMFIMIWRNTRDIAKNTKKD